MIRMLYEEESVSPKEQIDKILENICRTITRRFPAKAKEMLIEEGYLEPGDPRNVLLRKRRAIDRDPKESHADYTVHNFPFYEDDKIEGFIKKVLQNIFPKATENEYEFVLPSQPLTGSIYTESRITIEVHGEWIAIAVSAR